MSRETHHVYVACLSQHLVLISVPSCTQCCLVHIGPAVATSGELSHTRPEDIYIHISGERAHTDLPVPAPQAGHKGAVLLPEGLCDTAQGSTFRGACGRVAWGLAP